jgi:hypothetical protein
VFVAILTPIAITQFNTGNEIGHDETFVATLSDAAPESFTLGHKPVKPDSETVLIQATPAVEDTDYTINNLTAVLSIATASSDTDDVISVSYIEAVDFGGLEPLWLLIPTIALLGFIYKLYKSKGSA